VDSGQQAMPVLNFEFLVLSCGMASPWSFNGFGAFAGMAESMLVTPSGLFEGATCCKEQY
jgi:hypothetical protein